MICQEDGNEVPFLRDRACVAALRALTLASRKWAEAAQPVLSGCRAPAELSLEGEVVGIANSFTTAARVTVRGRKLICLSSCMPKLTPG